VGDSVRDSVGASVWASVRDSVWASVYGQHDAGWLAFYEFFRLVCGLTDQTEKLKGLTALARSAGWAIPHANVCWVSERHQLLARNPEGRLHSLGGPAVLYPDGWAIYAVNGTRVPSEWIENKAGLDAKTALTWANIEQRRAAMEILGWDRVLQEVGARVVQKDRNPMIGTLLEADLPDAPKQKFLKVKCGTGREFCLCVPPEMKTAKEAQLWMYPGLSASDLKGIVRT
jgi:hypothetical protein